MSTQGQGLTDLEARVAAQKALSDAVVAAFTNLEQQIAALQSQEGEVTDAQLETLAQTLQAGQDEVQAALSGIPAPASTPPAPPAPAPTAVTGKVSTSL